MYLLIIKLCTPYTKIHHLGNIQAHLYVELQVFGNIWTKFEQFLKLFIIITHFFTILMYVADFGFT